MTADEIVALRALLADPVATCGSPRAAADAALRALPALLDEVSAERKATGAALQLFRESEAERDAALAEVARLRAKHSEARSRLEATRDELVVHIHAGRATPEVGPQAQTLSWVLEEVLGE